MPDLHERRETAASHPSASGTELSASGTELSASGTELSASGTELSASGTELSASGTELSASGLGRDRSDTNDSARGTTLIGRAPAFVRALRVAERIAPLRQPVLLRGETGTGKELVARHVHAHGPRRTQAFVAINCAAIPETLAESHLFGHARGAFTGAHKAHAGAFSRAHRGTLFLDEVAELPLSLQAKLLRVLETGRVTPVGSEHEIAVDVRIVTATHRDLEAMVANGWLREDLFHRLDVLPLLLPPLRERREDIPALIERFASEAAVELGRRVLVSPAAMVAATQHDWPGNIRGLRNAVLRAAALCDDCIRAHDIVGAASPSTRSLEPSVAVTKGDYRSMRRELLTRVVAEEGSIRRAARTLNVPRSTLGTWLKKG